MSVVIETTIGDITVDLFVDARPIACLNFIKLCKLKYYNYNLFHTIERGFIAQTGDPTGAGNGGSSIWGELEGTKKRFFEAEVLPKIYHTSAGLLSLVSAGKNLVGSQFFFTLAPNLSSLDGIHCVIGEVVEGHETLRKLNEAIVDENFRPYQDIRITHTVILEDPFPNPRNLKLPSRSPSPSSVRLQNGRIAADEDIDDTDGKTPEELQEMFAEREAKARATILEIVGDLPDAEMAPPENVLFVCKLNPVTTDDDLEIIFSRFGKVKSCEVIRDRKTNDSLQYAFVEFEDQKACEAAYFKMDNVLIDDRRIHVDFSQSVAKVKWRGKGHGVEGSLKNNEFDSLRESNKNRSRSDRQRSGKEYYRSSNVDSRALQRDRNRGGYERDNRSRNETNHHGLDQLPYERSEQEKRRSSVRYRHSRSRSTERQNKHEHDHHNQPTSRRRYNYDSPKRRNQNRKRNTGQLNKSRDTDTNSLKKRNAKSKHNREESTYSSDSTESSTTESSSSDSSTTSSSEPSYRSNKKKSRKHKQQTQKRMIHQTSNKHKK